MSPLGNPTAPALDSAAVEGRVAAHPLRDHRLLVAEDLGMALAGMAEEVVGDVACQAEVEGETGMDRVVGMMTLVQSPPLTQLVKA